MLTAYTDLLDGIRSWYARREGDDVTAAYSAALALAFMCVINVAVGVVWWDLLVYGELRVVRWVTTHRAVSLPVPISIIVLHLAWARISGIHRKRGAPRSSAWVRNTRTYIVLTVLNFVASMLMVFWLRQQG